MKQNKKQAFTLIEVLVVVLIIGILAAVALPQYQKAVNRAHLAQAFVIFDTYRKGIELWLLENEFPTTATYFTGTQNVSGFTYGTLPVNMPLEQASSGYNTLINNVFVTAVCTTDRCVLVMRGYEGKWLNGCGFSMTRYPDGKWTLRLIVKDSNNTKATATQCVDVQKAICLWAQSQGFEAHADAKAQCNAQGITLVEY